ncbi:MULTISPECIES: PAAR domain-containing protein [Pantoea]|uniref:PAAR domain-containing protein n=1 Tax=Candidatus Pantoea communis TaxID=2608354 RepID=A0ABX0RNA1_9GAMM|nr:PAAR domain-containing protein [Pantoea sp. ME81]NIG18272.1 PAAR domain-containing protein [Pantoea communis]
MKGVIRIGDTLSSGGTVLQGSSGVRFQGKEVSCAGDKVVCSAHGGTTIAEGDEVAKINGKPVALQGHRCGCGCTLISSLPIAGRRQ